MVKGKNIYAAVVSFLAIFMFVGCDFLGTDLGEDEVKVLQSESFFVGDHYEDVYATLSEWGFTNIETEAVYDIVWGITKEGSTKSVSIDGSSDFMYGDVFKKDVLIVITYSMRVGSDPGDPLEENEAKVLSSESSFIGQNYEAVIETLQGWGFTNIVAVPVYDIVWNITQPGSTKDVKIAGVDNYKSGDVFLKDVEIVITYSMRVGDDPGDPIGENEAKVLSTESSFIGLNYESVVETLQGWGFTNIVTVPVYDIIWDITQPGSTKDVKIGGVDNYQNGDVFLKSIEIIVTYSMRDDDAPKYTITWEINGVIVETDYDVVLGSIPRYNGNAPSKTDVQYTYIFVGWSPTITSVAQDQKYVALFERGSVREYTITWKDADNRTIGTSKVPYGEVPSHDLPADTAQWDYTHWTPNITEVNSNATYTAIRILKDYEITWKDSDGSVLGTTIVPYGTMPTYDMPTDTADRYYIDWTPATVSVNGNATYTAVTVSFQRVFAFRAAVFAFTNYYADDVFTEDGNAYDLNKLHSYSDISGFFLYIDDEGAWSVKNENTWHVNHIQMTLVDYHTKIDVSLDVSYDGQYYVVSNLAGEAPSFSDFDSRFFSMQVLENNVWFQSVSRVPSEMIVEDRSIQPRYQSMYIDSETGEHLLLTYLIMLSIPYPNTYHEYTTDCMPVIYSNIEVLNDIFIDTFSIGDFFIWIRFSYRNAYNEEIKLVAYGVEYYDGHVVLLGMEQVS
jgi:lipoate-protein ligase A